jgi:hypothetical protein
MNIASKVFKHYKPHKNLNKIDQVLVFDLMFVKIELLSIDFFEWVHNYLIYALSRGWYYKKDRIKCIWLKLSSRIQKIIGFYLK